jgi:nitrile hydratase accessory protein
MPLATPGLADNEDGQLFQQPWQAQAFGLLVHLHQRGVFAWDDWVRVFSAEIAAHPAAADEDANTAYYRQWLAALETLVVGKGLATPEEIVDRKEAWRRAYRNTPHGQPVDLAHAEKERDADHDYDHHLVPSRQPVAVSPPRLYPREGD